MSRSQESQSCSPPSPLPQKLSKLAKLSVAHCKGQQLLQTVLASRAVGAGTAASCNLLMGRDMIMM